MNGTRPEPTGRTGVVKTGWDCWPPTTIDDVFNLYGGPRRFFLVNIPAALLALGADAFGSMRALLSLDGMQPTVRSLRLDGVYPVRGFKRQYIDAPLSCTFAFPGDWVYDPLLEVALQRRKAGPTYSSRGRASEAPLPLVSLCPQAGTSTGLSLALFANPVGRSATLAEALGALEEAQAGLLRRFLAGSAPGTRAEPVSAAASPATSAGGRDSYRLEMQVQLGASEAGQTTVEGRGEQRSVWTTAQLARGDSGKSYVLLLTGTAPLSSFAEDRALVKAAVDSLEAL